MQAATPPPRSPKATNPILRRARGFILATSIVLAGLCLAGPALADTTGTTGGLKWSDNGTAVTITGYTVALPADVTVPATINGHPVTAIGDSAFEESSLTTISLPNSITSIDASAFFNTLSLTSIVIPNSVTSIGAWAFAYTANLTRVTLPTNPNFITIAANVFRGAGFTSITIPANVTSIAAGAFAESHLSSVRFVGNLPLVGDQAFSWSSGENTVYRFANAALWPPIDQTFLGIHQAYFLLPPAAPTAVAGTASATITVAAPPAYGPTPTSYTVKAVSNPDKTCEITGPTGSCTVTGLASGTPYAFTAATHTTTPAVTSDASDPSNQVTPAAAPTPPAPAPQSPAAPASATSSPTVLPLASKAAAATTSTITTTFDAPGPGVVRQTGTSSGTRSHLRATSVTVCTTTKTITEAGTTTITCRLTSAAKRARTQHAITVTLATTFTPTSGTPMASTKTIRLARTPAKAHTPTTTPSNVTG